MRCNSLFFENEKIATSEMKKWQQNGNEKMARVAVASCYSTNHHYITVFRLILSNAINNLSNIPPTKICIVWSPTGICLCAINIIMYQQIHTILLCVKEMVIVEYKSLINKLKQLNKLKGTKAIARLLVLDNVLLN